MPRYKATIEYDGTFFNGFQKQKNTSNTIQEAVETALLKLTLETVTVFGSGRTDTGVHATGQVIHFDLSKGWSLHNIQRGLNFYLENIAILQVEEVDENFHARFDAIQREYVYTILNRQAFPVLEAHRVWHVKPFLDVIKMQEAAVLLIGQHDFKAFRSNECRSLRTKRTIDYFDVEKRGEKIYCQVKSRSFLHNQVRIMVGTLVWYALGKITLEDIRIALNTGVKHNIGPTAPAEGLCFKNVVY